MAIKFAIIIPAYKAHGTIRRALNSIQMQTRAYEAKVFLINDCDPTGDYNYLTKEYEGRINLRIDKTDSNGGPTAARNKGIELVIEECIPYILFMDADDCFYSPLTLHHFHKQLLLKNWDFIAGNFIEEINQQEEYYYKIHEDRQIWLFAKLYKTRIIRDNNIRFFHPSENEDVGFNLNYSLYIDSTVEIAETLYIWKWAGESITRKDNGAYGQYCVIGLYKNCLQVYNKLSKDKNISRDNYRIRVAQRMIMMYVDWNTKYAEWNRQVSSQLFELMREYYFRFYRPLEKTYTKRELMVCGRGIFHDDLDERAKIPFIDFLKRLSSTKYKELYYLAIGV